MTVARRIRGKSSVCGRTGALWRSDQLATLLAADFEPDEPPESDDDDDEEDEEEPESDLVVEADESPEDGFDDEDSDFAESDFEPESELAAAVADDLALSRESLR